MPGFYDQFWEMRQGGPHDKGREIFKCTDCGGETVPEAGHNGEPDPANCAKHCKSKANKKKPHKSMTVFNMNFDRIFPNAPGARM